MVFVDFFDRVYHGIEGQTWLIPNNLKELLLRYRYLFFDTSVVLGLSEVPINVLRLIKSFKGLDIHFFIHFIEQDTVLLIVNPCDIYSLFIPITLLAWKAVRYLL